MKTGIRKWFSSDEEADATEESFAFIETNGANGKANGARSPLADRPDDPLLRSPLRSPDQEGDETRRPRDRVTASLFERGAITARHLRDTYHQWTREGQKDTFWRVLARHPQVDPETVYAEAARIYAFRQAEVGSDKPDPGFVRRVVDSFTEEQRERLLVLGLLPLEYEIDAERGMLSLVFAAQDPARPETLRFVHELNLDHFELCYAPATDIIPLLETLFPKRNEYLERLAEDDLAKAFDLGASYQQKESQLVDEEALDAQINRSALINLFEAALVEAVRQGASDIHVFPNRHKHTEFFFRIDGELQLWHTEDKVHPEAMIAVVKDRCLNIDRFEREAAQDGYIQREVDKALIRYRVSVLPLAGSNRQIKAESVVIRVLDDRKIFTSLRQIGLLPGALERFNRAIRQPHGMVIMTGPTGSGKSTTLVAALNQIARPQINALTVEDPVEYIIHGVRQIKLGPRLTLDAALRSILRHDPDVVMVGEMRDQPTAELAIKLANTGHLTFSTLHTNDAPSAVSRLYKMGIEPFLIAYAINLVVAQRLIRKVCPTCREADRNPDERLLEELGFTPEEITTTTYYVATHTPGCPTCKGVGYKGRRAISEALYFSRSVRHLILDASDRIDEDAIRTLATREGMLTLMASAREVVKLGETTVDEVLRVTASE